MKKSWTAGLDERDTLDVEDSYRASTVLRRRLEQLCLDKAAATFKLSRSDYNCPNWQMLQADAIGYNRAIEDIISLIK